MNLAPRRPLSALLSVALVASMAAVATVATPPSPAAASLTAPEPAHHVLAGATSTASGTDNTVQPYGQTPYTGADGQVVSYAARSRPDFDRAVAHAVAGSRTSVDAPSGGGSRSPYVSSVVHGLSADGSTVLFTSPSDLDGSGNNDWTTLLWTGSAATGQTTAAVPLPSGVNPSFDDFALSGDGSWVVVGTAASLVAADTNGLYDVYRVRVSDGTTELVSTEPGSASMSERFPVSHDGDRIVYRDATSGGIMLFDAGLSAPVPLSTDPADDTTVLPGAHAVLSADGSHVAFLSSQHELWGGTSTAVDQVLVRELDATDGTVSGNATLASASSTGAVQDDDAWTSPGALSLSDDGSHVAFHSRATNLAGGSTNSALDVYVADLTGSTPSVTRASLATGGAETSGQSLQPAISASGRQVAYLTQASEIAGTVSSGYAVVTTVLDPSMPSVTASSPVLPDHLREPAVADDPDGSGGHVADQSARVSDPVNTLTGAYTSSIVDLGMAGLGVPAVLERGYTSAVSDEGLFGLGWSTLLDAHVTLDEDELHLRSPGGQTSTFRKAPDGSWRTPGALIDVSEPSGGGWQLFHTSDLTTETYDSSGRLVSVTDRNGNGVTVSWDTSGQPISVTDAAGRAITLTSGTAGAATDRITRAELPDGRGVDYAYTTAATGEVLLSSVTRLDGAVVTYGYTDAADTPAPVNLLAEVHDGLNNLVVANTYGADGRVVAQLDDNGDGGTFAWDSSTQTSTYTDDAGRDTIDVYRSGMLVSHTDPAGDTTTYGYSSDRRLVEVTTPDGTVTRTSHDTAGRPLQVLVEGADSTSALTTLTYTDGSGTAPAGLLESITDPASRSIEHAYDTAGNPTSTTRWLGTTAVSVSQAYDGSGRLDTVTDERGKTTSFGYDTDHQLTSITTPEGRVTTFGYDSTGRRTTTVEPRGNVSGATPADYTTTLTYDDADRVLTVTDPLGNTTTHVYDLAGNRISVTDAASNTTTFGYDGRNLLTSVTAPDLTTTTYAYDGLRNLTSRTDANSNTTTFDYDPRGLLASQTDPLGNTTSYTYDGLGRQVTRTSAEGNATPLDPDDGITTLTHDGLGRVTAIDYSDPATPDVAFGYDAVGRRTSMTDGAGEVAYTYDDLDRLLELVRNPTDPSPEQRTLSWTWDVGGNLLTRTHPTPESTTTTSTTSSYTYDDDSLLETATTPAGLVTYTRDAAGRQTAAAHPGGSTDEVVYDRAGRISSTTTTDASSAVVAQWDVTRDSVGNPTQVTTAAGTDAWEHDDLQRLTRVCHDVSACGTETDWTAFTYDDVGNRLTQDTPVGTTSYTYDDADRLTALSGLTVESRTWDADGRMLTGNGHTYDYDQAGRLVSSDDGTTTWVASYDGDGRRLGWDNGGTTASDAESWTWDPVGTLPLLVATHDGAGDLLERVHHDDGLAPLAVSDGTTTASAHVDALGSLVGLTDASTGAELRARTYTAFGELDTQSSATGAPDARLGFAWSMDDPAAGLAHLRARDYEAGTGRFTTTDPVAPVIDDPYVSSYVYVANQPGVLVDPNGEFAWIAAGAAVGAVVGGVSAHMRGDSVWAGVAVGAATGAVATATLGVGTVAASGAATAAAGAGIGATAHAGEEWLNGRTPTVEGTLVAGVGGAASGALGSYVFGRVGGQSFQNVRALRAAPARELMGPVASGHRNSAFWPGTRRGFWANQATATAITMVTK